MRDPGPLYCPGYQPWPKQQQLHRSTERFVLYGGAAGGGKTDALINAGVAFARQYPGVNIAFFRRTYPELEEAVIERFTRYVPPAWMVYNSSKHYARFANGSMIWFRHIDSLKDLHKRQGPEYQLILWDELTHFQAAMYDYMDTRLRTARNIPLQMLATSNPGGVGHAWVKARWIDRKPDKPVDLAQYRFIPASLDDNMSPMRDRYKADLAANPDEALRKALLDGDWNSFVGQFFREWRDPLHLVEPFEIPESWPRWLGFDYGGSAPSAGVWLAADPASSPVDYYGYREQYDLNGSLRSDCEAIVRLSVGERFRRRVADPSIFGKTQETASGDRVAIADQARGFGLQLDAAVNDRQAGWELMHELLAPSVRGPNGDLRPRLRFFRSCTDTARTLPALVHDRHRVEDVDTDGEDHLADGWRYAVMAAAGGGKKVRASAGAARDQVAAQSAYAGVM